MSRVRAPEHATEWRACGAVLALASALLATDARAACNVIPGSELRFATALGSTNRPFAAPGDAIRIRLGDCDAASAGVGPTTPVVRIAFRPFESGAARTVVTASSVGIGTGELSFPFPSTAGS